MVRKGLTVFILLLIVSCLSVPSHAQSWSGILSPSRATDWSTVGVVGDIPSASWPNCTTSACNTLYGGSVTATTIQNALTSAPANTVVRIPAGIYTVSNFSITNSNVVLRGAGATATKLVINSASGGGGFGLNRAISLMSGATGVGSFGGVTSANWTAGYSQGTTTITLSSTSGLVSGPVGTGSLIMLDQLNDTSDGYPATGDIYVCENTSNNCSNQGGNNYARSGRAQVQVVTVSSINGNQVTISPGLASPDWRSARSPGAYWNTGSPIHNTGIENLSVDFTGGAGSGLFILNAANCWVLGTRWIKTDTGTSEIYHIFTAQSAHLTIRSNYVYGRPYTGGQFPLANYPYTDQEVSDVLFENNIMHFNIIGIVPNDPTTRNVFSYNYVDSGSLGIAGMQLHSGIIMYDLFEGNNWESFLGDIIHGPHYLCTLFRNHFDGASHNNSQTMQSAIALDTNNRFFNVVGNVFGYSGYSAYQSLLTDNSNAVYVLGWQGNASGTSLNSDSNVQRTLMRWGNWDNVNSASRFVSAEVPSTITNYSNTVPNDQNLPPSFYLTSKPAWFGSIPWPPIGPDVTGGNVSNSPTGGHAYKIPARSCFENAAVDPAYPSSNPRILAFDAGTCYQGTTSVAPPTNLLAVPK